MKDKLKNIFSKKTIYLVESMVYVLSIIIVVIANVFGPIWIRMLPLLFVIGIIGKIAFNRPVVTTVFGSIISICVIYLSGVTNILENVIASGIFTLYIALGELCGSKIKDIYKYLISTKRTNKKQYLLNVFVLVVIIVLCTLFHNFTDSNIFTYNFCKNKLNKYLVSNYPNEDFNITYVKYSFESENSFKFNIQNVNTEDNYKFIVYVNKDLEIYDGIKEREKSKAESEIEKILNKVIEDKYKNIEKEVVKEKDIYELNLTKEIENIDDAKTLEFSKEVSDIIDLITENKSLENIEYINISLIDLQDKTKSKISTIYMSNYIKNKNEGIQKGYTYIMKSLNIEYID